MNAQELAEVLMKTIPAGLPTMTRSGPGIGKTDIHIQVAKRLGYDCLVLYPGLLDPTDFTGLSFPTEVNGEKRLIRHLDDILHSIFFAKSPLLVIIDELGQAAPAVQAACAPFFHSRSIARWKLPDHVTVATCTNRNSDRAGASSILTHIIGRMAAVLDLEVDAKCWLERAMEDQISSLITSFIKFRPSLLYEFDAEKVFATGKAYPSPRSWYKLNQLLNAKIPEHLEGLVFPGCIGEGASHSFLGHARQVRAALDCEAIVVHNKPWKFPGAKDLGLRYAFAFGVASFATRETLGRVFDIALKLCEGSPETGNKSEQEYAMVVVQQILLKDMSFIATTECRKMAAGPLGQLIRSVKLIA